MTFKDSIEFSYAGINSREFQIYNVTVNDGMYSEPFGAGRTILSTKIKGNYKDYFQGIELESPTLELSFAFPEPWNRQKLRTIARWLTQDYFQPLIFSNEPEKIYYTLMVGKPEIIHNGSAGYINLQMKMDSPYTYSPEITSTTYDFAYDPSGVNFTFINKSDLPLYPKIYITKVGAGDVSIMNTTNNNLEMKFTGLANNETVFVDCLNEIILSDLTDVYRYDNLVDGTYLYMLPTSFNSNGFNTLNITGACRLKFKYKFIYLA